VKYLTVMLAGFVLGGWAVPLGFVLDLGPVPTFLTAVAGGLLGLWLFLLAGDRIAAYIDGRRKAQAGETEPDGADADETQAEESTETREVGRRLRRIVDRYGAKGLGLIGPIFPGVTASTVAGLALGLDRRSLGKWMTIGIIVLYGLYTLGLSLLIWLF